MDLLEQLLVKFPPFKSQINEQKEMLQTEDINGETLVKGDKVKADNGEVLGKITAIWDDGMVDIEYAAGPGGPLADTFDIKDRGVEKLEESKADEQVSEEDYKTEPLLGKKAPKVPFEDTEIHTWFERDRQHVELRNKKTDETVIEWWDKDVNQAVEDGFLNPKDYHRSAYEYAVYIGLIQESRIDEVKAQFQVVAPVEPSHRAKMGSVGDFIKIEEDLVGLRFPDGKEFYFWPNEVKQVSGDPIKLPESKVNEDFEEEQGLGKEDKKNPPEDKPKPEDPDKEPEPDKTEPEEPEKKEVELEKVYLGRSANKHFYVTAQKSDRGAVEDLVVVDQEGEKALSAKEEGLDVNDVTAFIEQALQDSTRIKLEYVDRGVVLKYIIPKAEEELGIVEPSDEEELPPEGEAPSEAPEVEPKEPREVGEEEPGVGEEEPGAGEEEEKGKPKEKKPKKKEEPKESKTNEAKMGVDYMRTMKTAVKAAVIALKDKDYEAASKALEDVADDASDAAKAAKKMKRDADAKAKKEKEAVRAKEGKIPNATDSVDNQVKKLTEEEQLEEMKVSDGENTFEVTLVDEGALDTVIGINGREFRFDSEFASHWADQKTGKLGAKGLKELALDALANLEEKGYQELVKKAEEKCVRKESEKMRTNEQAEGELKAIFDVLYVTHDGEAKSTRIMAFSEDDAKRQMKRHAHVKDVSKVSKVAESELDEKLFFKPFKDLSVGADFAYAGKRCIKHSESEYKCKGEIHEINPNTKVGAIEKPRRGNPCESVDEATEGSPIKVYASATDDTPKVARVVQYERPPKATTAKLSSGETVKVRRRDTADGKKWVIVKESEDLQKDTEMLNEGFQKRLSPEVKKVFAEKGFPTGIPLPPPEGLKGLTADEYSLQILKRAEKLALSGLSKERAILYATDEFFLKHFGKEHYDYWKRREEEGLGIEESRQKDTEMLDEFVLNDDLQEKIEIALDEGKTEDEVDALVEQTVYAPLEAKDGRKKRPLKKGAAVRSRGDCVFPASSPKVKDKADHFPINSINQARNAWARANQYDAAPKWYDGSLSSLVSAVKRAVKAKYPSIQLGKGAKESIDEALPKDETGTASAQANVKKSAAQSAKQDKKHGSGLGQSGVDKVIKKENPCESKIPNATDTVDDMTQKLLEKENDMNPAVRMAEELLGILPESKLEEQTIKEGDKVQIVRASNFECLVEEATVHSVDEVKGIEITGENVPENQQWFDTKEHIVICLKEGES